jgi:hypothetical protein
MYITKSDFEPVQLTPEGKFLNVALDELTEAQVLEVCDVCEEAAGDLANDGLAQFSDNPRVVVAHYECGVNAGLELA